MKRRLRTILIFLLIGAVANVGVAWGFDCARNYILNATIYGLQERIRLYGPPLPPTPAPLPVDERTTNSDPDGLVPISIGGWPFKGFRADKYDYYNVDLPTSRWAGLRVTSIPRWLGVGHTIRLPLQPRWPGFLANTAFYTAAMWLPFLGARTPKSSLGRHRGRCLACGYDLRGTSHERCPECGRVIKGRTRIEARAPASGAVG
jgi:hypothetical protein